MTVKTKRIVKKVAKTGVWAVSDVIFLALKAIGTVLLIAMTTGVVFVCIFLIYLRSNLTAELDVAPTDFSMSLSSEIYYIDANTGRETKLVTLQSTEFRRWVDYNEMPEHLINALVSIEDHRFFRHNGVDWYRTAGAFMNMFLSMRDTFGGSTITQQLIKNLTQEDDVTVQRKLQEIFRALEYENWHEKDEILELYLNLVYFGHGCYGIGAAANYYFDKEVSELNLAESAAIVGITNNPSQYSPYANRESNKERQLVILSRMYELGYIPTEQEYRQARLVNLHFQRGEDYEYEQVIYTWFEEAIINDVIADIIREKGWSEQRAKRILYTGGLKVIATIDMDMQDLVDSIYQDPESLPRVTGSAQQLQSGIIIADPYTGEVKALSGGVGKKTRNMLLSRATMTRRPPGSALKPISVYAPAMENGLLTPDTIYDDSEYVTLNGTTWMPKNADRKYSGLVTVRSAIINSLNTIPAVVLDQLGTQKSFRFMRDDLGFDLHPSDEAYAPLAAGQLTRGATVREMTSAFTIFPNSGERVALRTYTVVYDSNGDIFINNTPEYTRAISEATAYWMTSMLHDAVTSGTGGSANLGRSMPTSGKTGTSTDSKDRWFVGFTPYYIAAVWTGYDTPAPMRSTGNPAAQIWKKIMAPIHEGLETRDYNNPGDIKQRPVAGVDTSYYTIKCVDNFGAVLYEESIRAVVAREITVNAPEFESYRLVGDSQKTIIVTGDLIRNTIIFIYEPEEPEVTEDPYDPYDPNNPYGPYDPNDPNNPYGPDNPYIPYDPNSPYAPNNPYDPNNPYNPYIPPDPNNPDNPYNPNIPPDPQPTDEQTGQSQGEPSG